MEYKVMIAGDLHKRMKDISTIKGYCNACRYVQLDLIEQIKKQGITHFISAGDWFHGGYGSDVAAALCHTDIDRDMADALNGNFYGVIGNHIRIQMDSNPELFLIQPHPIYRSRHDVNRTEQIIKTPDRIVLNGCEFLLKHWNPVAENALDYKCELDPECKHHFAVFHTEQIIPAPLLNGLNMAYMIADESKISQALNGVEIAIVGHIHKVIGTHIIRSASGKDTLMIIPGSLTNTDAGKKARHESVDIPIITILEDGNYRLEYYTQSLHTDKLTFYIKTDDDDDKNKLKSLNGNSKENLYSELQATAFIGDNQQFLTLNRFLESQGYTHTDKVQIRSVLRNPEDIDTLVHIGKQESEGL